MDGHLTVFHYDEENNIEIVFPKNRDDTIFLGKDEKRRVLIPTTEPKGKHFLKAVLTPQQIVDTRLVEAPGEILRLIEQALNSLSSLRDGEWMEAVAEFEVV
jgi:hypothetical protein